MLPPAVYATPSGLPVPVPVTLNVVGLVNVIVTGCCRLTSGGGGAFTLPALIVAEPVFAPAAAVRIGAAAATAAVSVIASAMLPPAKRVGWIRKLSPVAGAPAPEIVMPSTVCGRLA